MHMSTESTVIAVNISFRSPFSNGSVAHVFSSICIYRHTIFSRETDDSLSREYGILNPEVLISINVSMWRSYCDIIIISLSIAYT